LRLAWQRIFVWHNRRERAGFVDTPPTRHGLYALDLVVDERTHELLRRLREQQRGKTGRMVQAGDPARGMGIESGYPEYERRLADLVKAGYLVPNPNHTMLEYGYYEITDEGIVAAAE